MLERGGVDKGLELAGFAPVYSNEFDKYPRQTFAANYDHFLDGRDIREVDPDDVPAVDIISGGFPCQAFSIAGAKLGFEDTRGTLFYDLARIIEAKKPQAIFLENVKNLVTHDYGRTFQIILNTLSTIGYAVAWKVLNASTHGNLPQHRERVFIVGFLDPWKILNFDFPEPVKRTKRLVDVLDYETQLAEHYYVKPNQYPWYPKLIEAAEKFPQGVYTRRPGGWVRTMENDRVPTLTASMGTGGGNVPMIKTKHGIRALTPRECFNLQGFPDDYVLPDLPEGRLYKQAGNSVAVPVIERIGNEIYETLKGNGNGIFC